MEIPEIDTKLFHIDEPELGFGFGQKSDHPRDGLYLYGPHGNLPNQIDTMKVGILGTKTGIQFLQNKLHDLEGHIPVPPRKKTEKENRLHLSDFPGLAEAFGLRIDHSKTIIRVVSDKQIDQNTRIVNLTEAVSSTVDLYLEEIREHEQEEEAEVDVWFLVLPEIVFERCRPKSSRSGMATVTGKFLKKKPADIPLLAGLEFTDGEEIFDEVPDFHRLVKARMLQIGKTSQLVRETTLAPEKFLNKAGYPIRKTQDEATIAWQLATGLYYKSMPDPPWKLITAREGVCYMGLVFKKLPNHPQDHVCCAAQMFLNEGDGLVFRGANGPWETKPNEFHLSPNEAGDLVGKIIKTFKAKHGSPPRELFIHGRTKFDHDEWDAFCEACPAETNLVYVRIKSTRGETKLFRNREYPVIRGTAMILDKCNAYLWSSGFVPRIDTYMGPETPNPLFVTVLRSTGEMPDISGVLRDILGLTKINYNACNFNDGLPVTVRFADKVGDVLVQRSARGHERQPFKFYI